MNQTGFAEIFRTLWDSPHWRWWSLVGGCLLVAAGVLIGFILGLITGEEVRPLIALVFFAIVMVLSLIGSGMIESVNRRVTGEGEDSRQLRRKRMRGESDEEEERPLTEEERVLKAEQEKQDRRTVAAGLALLPVIVVFLYILFTI